MGDEYPEAEVLGLDLTATQPAYRPPNVTFIVDDIENEWTHASDYDLIALRSVAVVLKFPQTVLNMAFRSAAVLLLSIYAF